jgi:hypothetical protein
LTLETKYSMMQDTTVNDYKSITKNQGGARIRNNSYIKEAERYIKFIEKQSNNH